MQIKTNTIYQNNILEQNTNSSTVYASSSARLFCHSKESSDRYSRQKYNLAQMPFKGYTPNLRLTAKILSILNRLPISLSKYDTPYVKQIRQKILITAGKTEQTHKITTPEREQMRAELINRLLNSSRSTINQGQNFYMIIGHPGAGKSTLSQEIARQNNAFHLDYDIIKHQIPEFQDDKTYTLVVNREVTEITNKIVDIFTQKDYDIIVEDIAKNQKSIINTIKRIKAKGYKIHLKIIQLDPQTAFERTMPRFEETGRFSDPLLHDFFANSSIKLYESLHRRLPGFFSSYELYSSNVPKGSPFKLISKEEC